MKNTYLLLGAYLTSVSIILFFTFSHWAYDDPFITYRYAANLARGIGFVYNPGERVLSTTTPFFTLLLAFFSPLWPNLPHLANFIGAFSLALGGIFLWLLARSWKTPIVGWVGLFLYPFFPLLITTLGSETPSYLALCLGAYAFYAQKKYVFTAIFAALAVLTRPDAVLVPILLAGDYLLSDEGEFALVRNFTVRSSFAQNFFSMALTSWRSFPWPAIAVFLGLTLPWFIFALVYFGSPLPVTLAVKQHQGAMAISQRFAPGFLALARGYAEQWHYRVEAALALSGVFFMFWHCRRWILFLSWTLLYFLAYTLLGVSRYYWYYAPLVPGFVVLVGLGFTAIISLWSTTQRPALIAPQDPLRKRLLSILLTIALTALLVSGHANSFKRLRQQQDRRIQIYRQVGEWLKANTAPAATVATLEVGVIGYYAERPMVDFAGLIQTEVAEQLTSSTTYEDAALWAVERYHPDYLVLTAGHFPKLEQGYVDQYCQTLQEFPGEHYGYEGEIDIYACQ